MSGHRIYIHRAATLVWRSSPWLLIVSCAVMILQAVTPLAPIYVVKLIVDSVTTGGDFRAILPLILVAGAAILMTGLLQPASSYVREAQTQRLSDYVQDLIHAKSIELDLSYYEGPEFFDKLHRAQQEAPYRPAQVVDNMMSLLRSVVSIVGIAGLLLFALPWYTVILLFASAIPPALVRLLSSERMFAWQMRRTPAERHVFYLNWILTGRPHAKEIRLFGLGRFLSERSARWRKRLRDERLSLVARRSVGDVFASGFQALVVAGLLAYFAYRSINEITALGSLVLFFQAIQKGQQVLAELLRSLAELYETNLFLANAFDFLALSPTLTASDPVEAPQSPEKGLAVDSVSFSYPNSDRMVLDDVSLTVSPGEMVAVVGDNGAGKTTLIKLICRFYDPKTGVIRLGGQNVRQMDPAAIWDQIAVLFQDYGEYYYTAAENIWFGHVSQPPDEMRLRDAANRARVHSDLAALSDGYETSLGRWLEEGAELSGGQWKKLALARSLYRKAPILILDEPTAGLDPESASGVIDDLPTLANGRCLIVVSHNVAVARRAHRIYVMREGHVAEQGTHEQLMSQGAYYAGLYHMQLQAIQQGSNGQ